MHDPRNLGLHLELLSLLYAERNVDAFEDAAEAMHAHVVDPHQPEWLEAQAMGQELAPHNPLFSDRARRARRAFDDEAVTAPHATARRSITTSTCSRPPRRADRANAGAACERPRSTSISTPTRAATRAAAVPPPSEADVRVRQPAADRFRQGSAARDSKPRVAPAPLPVDEDEFPGEDGVGTKLDLAKAYLDMGDPEGARSMLEEVLAEGNDAQKGEARRLMAEIR